MTEKEAREATRYFGEGVRASILNCGDPPTWVIEVCRESDIMYTELDEVKREVRSLLHCARNTKALELCGQVNHPITFQSLSVAQNCVAEIVKAWRFIQSQSIAPCWQDVTEEIFGEFVNEELPQCR